VSADPMNAYDGIVRFHYQDGSFTLKGCQKHLQHVTKKDSSTWCTLQRFPVF
jgi:hypothetical protein